MSDKDRESEMAEGIEPSSSTETSEGAAMPNVTRRHLIMGAGMLAVGGAAFARMPKQRFPNIPDDKFEALFPKQFGDWRTLPTSELVMPPEGDLQAKLYQHILTRTYVNSKGEGVMFLVAYNSEQVNNVQVHRPEICYGVSGFKITQSRPYTIQMGGSEAVPARIVRAERVGRIENILYWTRIGDEFPQSWLQQRIAMTKANLGGFYADGLLVRASNIDGDTNASVAMLSEFLRELAQASPAGGRQLAFRA
ncbi:MAG: EpsI family protein [Sphingobium sp.]|nr:EpsI family protein [Sphingobium sp.]